MAHSSRRPPSPRPAPPEPDKPSSRAATGADPAKRKKLLLAATRTFGRRGFHEARIAEIAAAAGVAEGTVYLYFKNKEHLLEVVFDDTMDEVLARGREIAGSALAASDRLIGLVDLHISFLASNRHLASVFQIELRRSARLVERFSRSKLVEYFRLLDGILREGIASGEFRDDLDPRIAVRVLFGAADEILSEWLLSGEVKPACDGRRLVGTLLRGFLKAPWEHEVEEVSRIAARPGAETKRTRTNGSQMEGTT